MFGVSQTPALRIDHPGIGPPPLNLTIQQFGEVDKSINYAVRARFILQIFLVQDGIWLDM